MVHADIALAWLNRLNHINLDKMLTHLVLTSLA